MTEEQSNSTGGGGGGEGSAASKKARRGRRQDNTLPPSRSRDVQRAFRARRAAHLTYLETTVEWLQEENSALRQKCGLPLDGPPLTGPAPVEEIIEGPVEQPLPAAGGKKAPKPKPKPKGKKGAKARAGTEDEHSDGDYESKMEPGDQGGEGEEYSPPPQDDATRGAAQVLAAGGGNLQPSLSLPPMNVPSSTSPASSSHSHLPQEPPPSGPFSHPAQPQQASPRTLAHQQHEEWVQAHAAHAFQPPPPLIPYLVNHPHASVSFQSQPLAAYASVPSQHPHSYGGFPITASPHGPPQGAFYPPYNYPQPHQNAPYMQHQQQFSQDNGRGGGGGGAPFNMPPTSNMTSQPGEHHHPYAPPSMNSSHRNSISSSVVTASSSPQLSTPPSSHMRVATYPAPAPPFQHQHQQHQQHSQAPPVLHVYPTMVPAPSDNFPSKPSPMAHPALALRPINVNSNTDSNGKGKVSLAHDAPSAAPSQPASSEFAGALFPTPSPEDEQFFLDTFCGFANDNPFLQSLYQQPTQSLGGDVFGFSPSTAQAPLPNLAPDALVARTSEAGNGNENKQEGLQAGPPIADKMDRSDVAEKMQEGHEGKTDPDATRLRRRRDRQHEKYKDFCIGLMKGVKGIEGLIHAQKLKRKREHVGNGDRNQGGDEAEESKAKRRKAENGRQEKEDEAVAFLAEAAAMASASSRESPSKTECCDGLIDCGPPSTTATTPLGHDDVDRKSKKEDDCCLGLIDCGPVSATDESRRQGGRTNDKDQPREDGGGDECCSGLISCGDGGENPNDRDGGAERSSDRHASQTRTGSFAPSPSTIYLPRPASSRSPRPASKTITSDACCGPKTSCTVPSPPRDRKDTDPASTPSDAYILVSLAFAELSRYMSETTTDENRGRVRSNANSSPSRIAELLFDDNSTVTSPTANSNSGTEANQTPANLIIVPPTQEEEARGKKGELYVRKDVVESVKRWCERASRDSRG